MSKQGTNKPSSNKSTDKENIRFQREVDKLAKSVINTGVRLNQIRFAQDKEANRLRTAVQQKIADLFCLPIEQDMHILGGYSRNAERKIKLRANLEKQYSRMASVLIRYGLPVHGVPSEKDIVEALDDGPIQKVIDVGILTPKLLMIPPVSLSELFEATENHKFAGRQSTLLPDIDDCGLWNGGQPEEGKDWRIMITEGKHSIDYDTEFNHKKNSNYEIIKGLAGKYGENIMNDAVSYLILMISSIEDGKPVDPFFSKTVLNAKNLTATTPFSYGRWENGGIALGTGKPEEYFENLRVRPMVELKLPVGK